jgi:hypothetical protein
MLSTTASASRSFATSFWIGNSAKEPLRRRSKYFRNVKIIDRRQRRNISGSERRMVILRSSDNGPTYPHPRTDAIGSARNVPNVSEYAAERRACST